jgi:hypothetical protein
MPRAGIWMSSEVSNELSLVRTVLADLQHYGFEVLLMLDPPINALDAFLAERDEVVEKRLSQKRAYRADGVLVELFLAERTETEFLTIWWGRLSWSGPFDMSPTMITELPVASKAVLQGFRDSYGNIIAARPW